MKSTRWLVASVLGYTMVYLLVVCCFIVGKRPKAMRTQHEAEVSLR